MSFKIDNKILFIVAVFVSIVIGVYYSDELYLLIVPIVLVLKSKIGAFLLSSKSKIFMFLKTLTFYKAIVLGAKRFVIDNYFSKWLHNNIIDPIKKPIINYLKFFFNLGWKIKLKRLFLFFLPLSAFIAIAQITGILEHLLLYAELKGLVIGFFKIFFAFIGKVIGVFSSSLFFVLKNTWLASIIEIFALSWLLTKLEKIPLFGKYIVSFFNYISEIIGSFLSIFVDLYNKYIYSHLSLRIKEKMEIFGEFLHSFLEDTKHNNEVFLMKKFIKQYIQGNNFKDYYKKIDFSKIYNKTDIYKLINKKTGDNIDIKYFFNVDVNTIDKDVLILESVASCNVEGTEGQVINKNSFWVLNNSEEIVELISEEGHFPNKVIKPNKLILVHSLKQDFEGIKLLYKKEVLVPNIIPQK